MFSEVSQPSLTIKQIAEYLGAEYRGDGDTIISGVSEIETAGPGDLIFADSPKYLSRIVESKCGAALISKSTLNNPPPGINLILVEDVRASLLKLLELVEPPRVFEPGIHPTAYIAGSVQLGLNIHIGPNVRIGEDCVIEAGVALLSGVYIGDGCKVGASTLIHPNVTLVQKVSIGKRCIIHPGVVIGSDGFGYLMVAGLLRKIPHMGGVLIGDEVEIGANCCIDRAKMGVTSIGDYCKIDNLVHIGHNVSIGAGTILVAGVAIGGSTTIGSGVMLGGQVGVADHIQIGDGAKVAAQSGVISDVEAGDVVIGFPARTRSKRLREYAALTALPDAMRKIRKLEHRLAELEKKQGGQDN